MVEDNHAYQTQQFKKKKLFYFGKSKNAYKKSNKKTNLIFSKIVCPRFCGHNVGVVVDYTDMMSG